MSPEVIEQLKNELKQFKKHIEEKQNKLEEIDFNFQYLSSNCFLREMMNEYEFLSGFDLEVPNSDFPEALKARCQQRALNNQDTMFSYFENPEAATNTLYFNLVNLVFAEKTYTEKLNILLPVISKHIKPKAKIDPSTAKGNSLKHLKIDLQEKPIDELENRFSLGRFKQWIYADGLIFDCSTVDNYHFPLHQELHKQLTINYPQIASKLYSHNVFFRQVKADIDLVRFGIKKPRIVIQELIKNFQRGGEKYSGDGLSSDIGAAAAFEEFREYLERLDETFRNQLLSLAGENSDNLTNIIKSMLNYDTSCVEQAALKLTSLLENKDNQKVLDTTPRQNIEVTEAAIRLRYKPRAEMPGIAEENKLDKDRHSVNIPTHLMNSVMNEYPIKDKAYFATLLLTLPVELYPAFYNQFISTDLNEYSDEEIDHRLDYTAILADLLFDAGLGANQLQEFFNIPLKNEAVDKKNFIKLAVHMRNIELAGPVLDKMSTGEIISLIDEIGIGDWIGAGLDVKKITNIFPNELPSQGFLSSMMYEGMVPMFTLLDDLPAFQPLFELLTEKQKSELLDKAVDSSNIILLHSYHGYLSVDTLNFLLNHLTSEQKDTMILKKDEENRYAFLSHDNNLDLFTHLFNSLSDTSKLKIFEEMVFQFDSSDVYGTILSQFPKDTSYSCIEDAVGGLICLSNLCMGQRNITYLKTLIDDEQFELKIAPAGFIKKLFTPLTNMVTKSNSHAAILNLSSSQSGGMLFAHLLDKYPSMAQAITAEDLCRPFGGDSSSSNKSLLALLTISPWGCMILKKLLEKNPQLALDIGAEALCVPNTEKEDPLCNGTVLLNMLTIGSSLLELLVNLNPRLADGITEEALCVPLTEKAGHSRNLTALLQFSMNDPNFGIFEKLLDLNPQIAEKIRPEALCLPLTHALQAFENITPLYQFSKTERGSKILHRLIQLNPNLAKGITANTLCFPLTEHSGALRNTTPLYNLARVNLSLLGDLLDSNPELAEGITAEALCLPLTEKAGADHNVTPLYLLVASEKGCAVLKKLLEKNPTLAQGITPEALCLPLTKKAGALQNRTPLLNLVKNDLSLLDELLDSNPELAQGITAEALCLPLTEKAGASHNVTPLDLLVDSAKGCAVLNKLVEKNPQLAKRISPEALCLPRTEKAGAFHNRTPLLNLVYHDLSLLDELLDSNPELAQGITAEALCLPLTEKAGASHNITPLDLLVDSVKGCAVLKKLVEKNPQLAKRISPEALCLPRTEKAGAFQNKTPLLNLVKNDLSLLDELLDSNPDLAQGITAEALCLPLTEKAGASHNITPLNLLVASVKGCAVLKKLVEKNPQLAKRISPEALCLPRTEKAGAFHNSTPLLNLVNSDLSLLNDLLALNPDLAKGITAEALCLPLTEKAGSGHNVTPLYLLVASEKGRAVLKTLLEQNPQLAKGISPEALCLPRTEKAGAFHNRTPLLNLLENDLSLLNNLLELNPDLADGLWSKAWGLIIKMVEEKTDNTFSLDNFVQSPLGWEIIGKFLEYHPIICRIITQELFYLVVENELFFREFLEQIKDVTLLHNAVWDLIDKDGMEYISILGKLMTNPALFSLSYEKFTSMSLERMLVILNYKQENDSFFRQLSNDREQFCKLVGLLLEKGFAKLLSDKTLPFLDRGACNAWVMDYDNIRRNNPELYSSCQDINLNAMNELVKSYIERRDSPLYSISFSSRNSMFYRQGETKRLRQDMEYIENAPVYF